MTKAIMTEAQQLADTTEQLLEDATETTLRAHVLQVLVDRRARDAESHMDLTSDPETEVIHDHLSTASRNLAFLLARLDDALPTPGPAAREQAWEGGVDQ